MVVSTNSRKSNQSKSKWENGSLIECYMVVLLTYSIGLILLYIVLLQVAQNAEHKIEFWYSTSWIITLGPSWPCLCWLKSWMQWLISASSSEIRNHTVLSPKQAKPPEKYPMNPTKGVCNTLWNINHKVQFIAQVPGSILFILGFKLLHRNSVCSNAFNIVK